MRHKITTYIAVGLMALAASACGDDTWKPQVDKQGTLSLGELSLSVDEKEKAPGSRAQNLDAYIIDITQDDKVVESWTYGALPEIVMLPVGNYKIVARSGEVQDAAFDAPYYEGSQAIAIADGKVTHPDIITCKFANIRVTIKYDPALKAQLDPEAFVEVKAGKDASLSFALNETRSGYFRAVTNSTTLVATLDGIIDNNAINLRKSYTNVAPGTHYIITYSLVGGGEMDPETGNITIDTNTGIAISFDIEETESNANVSIDAEDEIEGVVRPGQEEEPEPDQPATPDDPASPFQITSETLSFSTENPTDVASALVRIHSDNGIAHLHVKIDSDNAAFIASAGEMLPLSFDLAEPGTTGSGLASLGLPIEGDVIGQKDVDFNITELVPLLEAFPGHHSFTLRVIDSEGNETTRILKFKA